MWLWLVARASAADCEPVDSLVQRMAAAVLEANMSGASELAERADASLGCGAVTPPETLGRLWVINGVLAWINGDEDGARRLLASGQRLAPGAWDAAYGDELTAVWSDLEPVDTAGTISMSPALAKAWTVSIDGAPAELPVSVPEGLHAVQVHHKGEVALGKVVFVPGGESIAISHTLPEQPSRQPEPNGSAPPPAPAVAASLSVALGVDAAIGDRLDDAGKTEGAGKVSVPLELGIAVEGSGLWFRSAATLAPLLGGSYLFSNNGEPAGSPLAVGGHVAGGPRVGTVNLGLLAGVQWPGRIPVRALASFPLGDLPLRLEARLGVNIATAGRYEPAGGVNLSFLPWL